MSEPSWEAQLEELLSWDVSSLIDRQRSEFNQITGSLGESFVLFGAGRLGRIALGGLRHAGIEPMAFTDNNPQLWNTSIDRLQVLSPAEAVHQFGRRSAFVVTVYTSGPVKKQLLDLGIEPVSFASLAWAYPGVFLPHGALGLPHAIYEQADDVRGAISLWADEASRVEYVAQLKWRTLLDPSVLPAHLPLEQMYFPDDLVSMSPAEVFVDCGAYDGDSVRAFLKRQEASFSRIMAIEPDPANYRRLQAYLSSLPADIGSRVTAIPFAVGSCRQVASFDATGTLASAVGTGTLAVECAPLDELLEDWVPSYIKMDVEGAESEALRGCRRVIDNHLPVLAVCVYHQPEDLWKIPSFIQSMSGRYRLFLRRYLDECWELVCYAVPVDRCKC
jgi:FkbM family methyltransferase